MENPPKVGNFEFKFALSTTDTVAQYGENSIFLSLQIEKL